MRICGYVSAIYSELQWKHVSCVADIKNVLPGRVAAACLRGLVFSMTRVTMRSRPSTVDRAVLAVS